MTMVILINFVRDQSEIRNLYWTITLTDTNNIYNSFYSVMFGHLIFIWPGSFKELG